MKEDSERREARRFTMALPMRIFPQKAVESEFRGQTQDVSYRGLYFLADARKFTVGSEIEFEVRETEPYVGVGRHMRRARVP